MLLGHVIPGCVLWCCAGCRGAAEDGFRHRVQSILEDRCVRCHGDDMNRQGGLDMRTLAGLRQGGSSGPVVVPGDVERSLMYQMVRDGEMPPEGEAVTLREVDVLRDWIEGWR